MNTVFPSVRLRRMRQNSAIRNLVRETHLTLNDLICPLFIKGKKGDKTPIRSMPGYYQIPLNKLSEEIEELSGLGIHTVILFGVPANKDPLGSDSYNDQGIIQEAIKIIKKTGCEMLIISDICFCEYTDHGHCGILSDKNGEWDIDNDKTLEFLTKQAVSHAKAGADVIAPSGMIDGMVKAIRRGLDEEGFEHIPILSYSIKYNSSMYGPFRMAAEGVPQFGDRSTHMMDYCNGNEAIREAQLDISEGADMLMVKPANCYLDIIFRIKQSFPYMPLGAYHVSGEFSMIKAASEKGWIDEKKVVLETLNSIRRAGADFIITYFTKDLARWKLIH